METTIKLIYWGIMAIVAILFLLSLQSTLKAATPGNRRMQPGLVWIQLLPLIGLVYSFIVARKVSDTIVAEYRSKGQHLASTKPTYGVGVVLALFSIIVTVVSIYFGLTFGRVETIPVAQGEIVVYRNSPDEKAFAALLGIVSLTWFVLFIIYWVQTATYKKKMINLPDGLPDDSIFNHS